MDSVNSLNASKGRPSARGWGEGSPCVCGAPSLGSLAALLKAAAIKESIKQRADTHSPLSPVTPQESPEAFSTVSSVTKSRGASNHSSSAAAEGERKSLSLIKKWISF